MAKRQKQKIDWFRHDKDMRHDLKIQSLRNKFPGWGYAVFNMTLEVLLDSGEFLYEWNELSMELMASDFGINTEDLTEIIAHCLRLQLFQVIEVDGKQFLTSENFRERLQESIAKAEQISEVRRMAGLASAAARSGNSATNAEQMFNVCPTIVNNFEQTATDKKGIEERRIEENRVESYFSSSLPRDIIDPSTSDTIEKEINKEKEQQEEYLILNLFLFDKNFMRPEDEYERLKVWNSRPGQEVSWSAMTLEMKLACAKMWQSKEEKALKSGDVLRGRFSETFLMAWRRILDVMFSKQAPYYVIKAALSDNIRLDADGKNFLLIYLPQNAGAFIQKYNTECNPILDGAAKAMHRDGFILKRVAKK